MPQEPDWNWKAVVAGALSNPLVVTGVGAGALLKVMMTFVPAEKASFSDEEREQKRAEARQKFDAQRAERREALKHDPKQQRFNRRFKIGMTTANCASGILQGYVAGRAAKKHRLAHAAASHVLTFLVTRSLGAGFTRSKFAQDAGISIEKRPLQNRLFSDALEVGCVLLGGYLSRRK